MTPTEIQAALRYLAPPKPAYWDWDDEFSAIAWDGGPTITLRQELAIALSSQTTRGLPDLSAVLIILSACRESWRESHSALLRIIAELGCTDRYLPPWISELFVKLEHVHAVARTLLPTAQRKADLLAYLFADQVDRATSRESAPAIVQFLQQSSPFAVPGDLSSAQFDLWRIVSILRGCLEKFDDEAFAAWLKTGIAQEVRPAEIELSAGQRVRALLTELNDHHELGGVARLARQLLAAITLPRPLAEPDDLPLGGVSDIANRGNLDRLLISELAHDDLTLAVRIASGEALYYRRETPPKSPPLRRMIVLDTGLRQWGVPRIFTTAVGLALAAAGDDRLAIDAFRASGPQLTPVDLTRREGLEQHLAALEIDLHLGAALPAVQEQAATAAQQKLPTDIVLVTSDDSLADEEFRRQLRAAELDGAWIAAINRNGRVRLLELGRREMVLKREATFDLEQLLAPTKKPAPALLSADPRLPAFCRLKDCPLRLPHDLSVDRAWAIGDEGVLAIYKDYRLTWWSDPQYGPVILADNMPRGRVHWADSRSRHMPFRAVVGTLSNRGLRAVQAWPREREVHSVPLQHEYAEQFTTVTATAEHIYLIGPKRVVAFSWTGEELATDTGGFAMHISGRYFACGGSRFIAAITVNGRKLGLSSGFASRAELTPQIITIAGDSESPQALSSQGFLTDLSSRTDRVIVPANFQRPLKLAAVSRDGQRIAVHTRDDTRDDKLLLIELESAICKQVWGDPFICVEPRLSNFISRRVTLRQHFRGIYVTPQGGIALASKRGQELSLVPQGKLMWRDTGESLVRHPQLRQFETVDAPSGYLLQRTIWPDGSEAWLDSRGLLHLRSSNPQVPELTFVLHEGEAAGWTSADGAFGNAYFTEAGVVDTPRPVLRALHAFIGSLVNVITT